MSLISEAATIKVPRKWRFRFVVFFVKIWLRKDCLCLKPFAVGLKRFNAPEFDLIFGIVPFSLRIGACWLSFLFRRDDHDHLTAL